MNGPGVKNIQLSTEKNRSEGAHEWLYQFLVFDAWLAYIGTNSM